MIMAVKGKMLAMMIKMEMAMVTGVTGVTGVTVVR